MRIKLMASTVLPIAAALSGCITVSDGGYQQSTQSTRILRERQVVYVQPQQAVVQAQQTQTTVRNTVVVNNVNAAPAAPPQQQPRWQEHRWQERTNAAPPPAQAASAPGPAPYGARREHERHASAGRPAQVQRSQPSKPTQASNDERKPDQAMQQASKNR